MDITNLEDAAEKLGSGRGSYGMDQVYSTVGDLVDDLIDAGNQDEVFVHTDSHLGLKNELSDMLLKTSIEDVDTSKYQGEIEAILDECSYIIPLIGRVVTEDLAEEIAEDKMARGEGE